MPSRASDDIVVGVGGQGRAMACLYEYAKACIDCSLPLHFICH